MYLKKNQTIYIYRSKKDIHYHNESDHMYANELLVNVSSSLI